MIDYASQVKRHECSIQSKRAQRLDELGQRVVACRMGKGY